MTWWKVSYDFSRPNWQAFGHVLFVQAETRYAALIAAEEAIDAAEPGALVTRLDVTASSPEAQQRFMRKVEARARWMENVRKGIPNQRGDI